MSKLRGSASRRGIRRKQECACSPSTEKSRLVLGLCQAERRDLALDIPQLSESQIKKQSILPSFLDAPTQSQS